MVPCKARDEGDNTIQETQTVFSVKYGLGLKKELIIE
jgi:hypothetical protein